MKKPWVAFELQPITGRKTRTWIIKSLFGESLGTVKWFGSWRQYSFFPHAGTVYERECLRAIADFCEKRTLEHRAQLPKLTMKAKAEA